MQRAFCSRKFLSLPVITGLLVSLFPGLGGPRASQASSVSGGNPPTGQSAARPAPVTQPRAFVNYRGAGKVGCREATETEVQTMKRRTGESLHYIAATRSSNNPAVSAESAGLQIVLRATSQLENYPAAKAAFLNAAAHWQSLINTPITVVVDVDFGPTWFGETYDKDVLGQTDSQTLGDSSIYQDVRGSLIGLGLNDDRAAVYNQLPQSAVPTDIGSTAYVLAPSALWRALGFLDAVADPSGEKSDLGDPPAVGFNSAFDYDFDPSDGVDTNKIDFDSVATHELGHVLGFDSNTGYTELDRSSPVGVTVWDIFRFRPGTTLGAFATGQRILSSGGNQDFFDGSREVALSTGRPDGSGGDREQASHWKDDFYTGQYIGIMDPTLADGERDEITDNDIAALKSFGYTVNASGVVPDAPTITGIAYGGKKMTIKGTGFGAQVAVLINGQAINPPDGINLISSSKIKIKAARSTLNLQSGLNEVQIINNGVSSNAFAFSL
jgi:hypothetical protein